MDREALALLGAAIFAPALAYMAATGLLASTAAWLVFSACGGGVMLVRCSIEISNPSHRGILLWLGAALVVGGILMDVLVFG